MLVNTTYVEIYVLLLLFFVSVYEQVSVADPQMATYAIVTKHNKKRGISIILFLIQFHTLFYWFSMSSSFSFHKYHEKPIDICLVLCCFWID